VSNEESYLLLVVAVHFVVYRSGTFVASELFLVGCSNVVHEGYCRAPLEYGMTLVVRTSHRSVEVSLR
jgi:hypothetical protein